MNEVKFHTNLHNIGVFSRNQHGKTDKADGDGVAHNMDVVDLKHTMIEEEKVSNNLKIKVK